MTRKERYLKALRREQTDRLVWAPNFDWWYGVNAHRGTIPEEYKGLTCNDLIRAVGGTIWRRCGGLVTQRNGIRVEQKTEGGRRITRTTTPVGDLITVHIQASEMSGAWFLKEHAVKRVEDLRPLLYTIEATTYAHNPAPALEALKAVGEDGVCLTGLGLVPYIQFAKTDVGYENAFYMMADHPQEVDRVILAYHRKFLEAAEVVKNTPLELITNGDNMDQWTCPPRAFLKYAVPYYRDLSRILRPQGKIQQAHWCGRTEALMPHVPDCGLDVIEAIVTRPMSQLDIEDALNACQGKVVVQGGVPAVLMCEVGGSREDLRKHVSDALDRVGHRPGFILGMGDNVPANADFSRVKMVSDMVEEYNDTVRPGRV